MNLPPFIVLSAALVTACGSQQYMTVKELEPRIDELNGKTVTVAGYLGQCFGYECGLYTDETSARQSEEWSKQLLAAVKRGERPHLSEVPGVDPTSIGIGSGEYVCDGPRSINGTNCHFDFDRKAEPFWHRYVLITGKVTNRCRYKGEPACTDRSTDLEPISIRTWKRPKGATRNG